MIEHKQSAGHAPASETPTDLIEWRNGRCTICGGFEPSGYHQFEGHLSTCAFFEPASFAASVGSGTEFKGAAGKPQTGSASLSATSTPSDAANVPRPASETGQASAWQPITSELDQEVTTMLRLLHATASGNYGTFSREAKNAYDLIHQLRLRLKFPPLPRAPSEDETTTKI